MVIQRAVSPSLEIGPHLATPGGFAVSITNALQLRIFEFQIGRFHKRNSFAISAGLWTNKNWKCIKWRRNYTRENKIISDRWTLLILQGFLPFEICMGPVTGHAYSGVWSVSRYGPYLLFSSPGSMSRSSWYASPHCQSKKHFSFTFAFHGHSWYFTSSQP